MKPFDDSRNINRVADLQKISIFKDPERFDKELSSNLGFNEIQVIRELGGNYDQFNPNNYGIDELEMYQDKYNKMEISFFKMDEKLMDKLVVADDDEDEDLVELLENQLVELRVIKNSLPFIRSQIDAKIDSELMNDEKWDEYTKEHSSCICKNSTENYQFSSDKAMKSNNFYSDLKEEYNANNDAFWENNKMSMYNDLQKTKFIEMIDVLEKA